jgi:hypothetical protein
MKREGGSEYGDRASPVSNLVLELLSVAVDSGRNGTEGENCDCMNVTGPDLSWLTYTGRRHKSVCVMCRPVHASICLVTIVFQYFQ